MSGEFICAYCGLSMPPGHPVCPHCVRPAASYPNVYAAEDEEETVELENRYQEAIRNARLRSCGNVLSDFEKVVATKSNAVIASNFGDIQNLMTSDNVIYATYYQLLKAGLILHRDDEMNRYRKCSEEFLFPDYKEEIRFGALSLDGLGVQNYAMKKQGVFPNFQVHLSLNEEMIAHRSSVFEGNNVVWTKFKNPAVSELVDFPRGYRAIWSDRGKIAAVKHVNDIDSTTTKEQYPGILLCQGTQKEEDEFIEVHIYGSITRRALRRVKVKPPTRNGKKLEIKMIKEKLDLIGVELEVA